MSISLRNKIALRSQQGDTFSWKEFSRLVDSTTYYLQKMGVTSHSGVAFCAKNNLEVVLLYLATIQLGARILGINPAFPLEKMRSLCQENDIQFYYAPNMESISSNLISLNLNIELLVLGNELAINSLSPNFNLAATMTLTSGSTGSPKAVVHSVQNHLDNAQGVCELMDFHEKSSWLLSLPIYHVSGQGIIWRWLIAGGELHLPQHDFYFSVLQATHCSLVPTQLQRLLDYVDKNKINQFNIQHILLGGAYIPVKLTQKLLDLGICSYSGYGMTEMASTVFAKKSNELRGVGNLLKGRQAKLVNHEIWLRGAGLALGYWKKGQIVPLLNQEGWFATKDQGIWENGELVLLGRIDNMFISGGENIHPEEIERVIIQYPEVEQVFVFPILDKEFGNRPIAMVKLNGDFNDKTIDCLQTWLLDKLEKFKKPIHYFNLDCAEFEQQGQIKISRALLQKKLTLLLKDIQ